MRPAIGVGGQFFDEFFLLVGKRAEVQCFRGDRAFWVDGLGRFGGGFVGLMHAERDEWTADRRLRVETGPRPWSSEREPPKRGRWAVFWDASIAEFVSRLGLDVQKYCDARRLSRVLP